MEPVASLAWYSESIYSRIRSPSTAEAAHPPEPDRLSMKPSNLVRSIRYESIVFAASPFSIRQNSRKALIPPDKDATLCIVPMIQYSRKCLKEECSLRAHFGSVNQ